jgi:hypothetical protein
MHGDRAAQLCLQCRGHPLYRFEAMNGWTELGQPSRIDALVGADIHRRPPRVHQMVEQEILGLEGTRSLQATQLHFVRKAKRGPAIRQASSMSWERMIIVLAFLLVILPVFKRGRPADGRRSAASLFNSTPSDRSGARASASRLQHIQLLIPPPLSRRSSINRPELVSTAAPTM